MTPLLVEAYINAQSSNPATFLNVFLDPPEKSTNFLDAKSLSKLASGIEEIIFSLFLANNQEIKAVALLESPNSSATVDWVKSQLPSIMFKLNEIQAFEKAEESKSSDDDEIVPMVDKQDEDAKKHSNTEEKASEKIHQRYTFGRFRLSFLLGGQ